MIKERNPRYDYYALGLLGLFVALALFAGNTQAQLFTKWEQVQTCSPSTSYWTRNGAESGQFRDNDIQSLAKDLGYKARVYDYADPVDNQLGLEQRAYLIRFQPKQRQTEGTFVYFHGGGGDRGFADNFGDPSDPKSTSAVILYWLEKNHNVVLVEYPRGWMAPQWCDDCPWNTSDAAYAREEPAARQSFEYSRLAIEYIARRSKGDDLLISGTSFGAAIVLYVTAYAPQGFAEANNIKAGLVGYGAALSSDLITDNTVPLLFLGGIDDNIVPADGGNFYFNNRGLLGDGVRSAYHKYVAAGGQASAVFSFGAATARGYQPIGHGYGLFLDHLEVMDLFRNYTVSFPLFEENRLLTADSRGRPSGYEIFDGHNTPNPDIPNCN